VSQRTSLLLICVLVLLLGSILACGLGTPTPEKSATATQEAPQAIAEQTATAQAVPTDTPTPRPTATPTVAEPTATSTPAPPTATPAPTDTPAPVAVPELGEGLTCAEVFTEDFTRPDPDWPVGRDSYCQWGPEDGEYQILVKEPDYYYLWSNGLRAGDFVLEMDARNVSGNMGAYGLAFGMNRLDDGDNFYAFFVDTEGYFSLYRHQGDNWTELVEWTYSPALAAGDVVNRLRVERRGDEISLMANGTLLTTVTDTVFKKNRYIALLAETFDKGDVDARFDNIIACLSPQTWPVAIATPTAAPQPTAPPAPEPTPTPEPSASSGFDVPPGKALFVFYNYTDIDWNIDVGPYFLAVPANVPGQEYSVATVAIDPGTYTWQGTSPGGKWYIRMGEGGSAKDFTVAAGDVYIETVR
jgi:hypothetical protein